MDIRQFVSKEDRDEIINNENKCFWCGRIGEVGYTKDSVNPTCLKCALLMLSKVKEDEASKQD